MVHGQWLAKWKAVVGDKAAVIDETTGQRVTYRELDERADRAANLLCDRFGVGFGDRVAVLGQNRLEQVELFFACAKLGAVLVPLNWRLAPDEVAWILRDAAPAVLLWGADLADGVAALRDGRWSGPFVPFDGDGPDGYAALTAAASAAPVRTAGIADATPLLLLYTSGTTGRPKGALLTHGTITWNAVNTATGWDLHHDDVTLTHAPMFHTGGWNVLTLPLLHRGATVVLSRKFDAVTALRSIAEHKVTVFFAVPTMFQMLLDAPGFADTDLSSVRFFISGGAPCPVPLIREFQRHGVVFKQGYGLTEVGPNCFVLHERDAVRKAGSVGFPVLHLATRLADPQGREVPRGEVGELQLRGPTVCAGYWNNPEATAKALSSDGWFATGDLFRQDEEGYHFVVGRLKELYISGGENVYPAEVERVLYAIAGVKEAAVVGVPDPKWGEVGHAFLAFDPAASPATPEQVVEHCRKALARYKVPKYVTLLGELPKGSSGKIHKQELQQGVAAGRFTTAH